MNGPKENDFENWRIPRPSDMGMIWGAAQCGEYILWDCDDFTGRYFWMKKRNKRKESRFTTPEEVEFAESRQWRKIMKTARFREQSIENNV